GRGPGRGRATGISVGRETAATDARAPMQGPGRGNPTGSESLRPKRYDYLPDDSGKLTPPRKVTNLVEVPVVLTTWNRPWTSTLSELPALKLTPAPPWPPNLFSLALAVTPLAVASALM